MGLLEAFRCLGTGEPIVGVELSEDNPESRPSSQCSLDASLDSCFVFPLGAWDLPVKVVRFLAPLDPSGIDDAITLN